MLLFLCIYISLLSACVAFFAFLNFPFVAIQWSEKKKGGKHFDITFLFRPHRQRCRILLVRSIANRLVDFLYIFSALLCSSSSPFPPLHLPRLRSDARTGGIWRVSVRIKPRRRTIWPTAMNPQWRHCLTPFPLSHCL